MPNHPTYRELHDIVDPLVFLFTNKLDSLISYDMMQEQYPRIDPGEKMLDAHYMPTGIVPSLIGKDNAYDRLCRSYRAMRYLECLDSPFVGGYRLDAPYEHVTRPEPAFVLELCNDLLDGLAKADNLSRADIEARADIVLPDMHDPVWAHLTVKRGPVVAALTLMRLFQDNTWVASLPERIDTVAQLIAKRDGHA